MNQTGKRNLSTALLICGGYLAVFLGGKWILHDNPGLSFMDGLTDTAPANHSYLFGWLLMHGRYLTCSLISILPALWGKGRFSAAVFTGFAAGLLLGEAYHFFFWDPERSGFPRSWCIWLTSLLASILIGIFLELRRKNA